MMPPIRLFAGYDEREKIGFHTFVSSVIRRSSRFVQVTAIPESGMGHGSNAFTFSRFLVPFLCGFQGHAIFADGSDMLCLEDIAKLDRLFDPSKAVQVVKHAPYDSQHARKYVGTEMECAQSNYERKNWASLMIVNCGHEAWSSFTPRGICAENKLDVLQFKFIPDNEIGEIPGEWNVLVDEGQDDTEAKILHWSSGIPSFPHYRDARRSKTWFNEFHSLTGNKTES